MKENAAAVEQMMKDIEQAIAPTGSFRERPLVQEKIEDILEVMIGNYRPSRVNMMTLVMAFLPEANACTTVADLRDLHIRFVLACAEKFQWCGDVQDYLSDCWGEDDPLYINEHWHHPDTMHAPMTTTWGRSSGTRCRDNNSDHCECGHMCEPQCRPVVLWSTTLGHSLIHGDGGVSCGTCGAFYDFLVDERGVGSLVNSAGEPATPCSRSPEQVHGLERLCEAHNGDSCQEARESGTGACVHVNHDCNCCICTG